MKSLLEAVTIIVLFFLTPVIAVWVLIGLARVIENIGDLPIDERETLPVRQLGGRLCFKLFLCHTNAELSPLSGVAPNNGGDSDSFPQNLFFHKGIKRRHSG